MRKLGRPWRTPEERRGSLRSLQKKLARVSRLLENHFGIPQKRRQGDLLEVLIGTILSQNTSDRNSDRAFENLKRMFPRWENVLESNLEKVVLAIRSGGLARQKAKRIREMLRWLKKKHGELSLNFLKKMDSETIKSALGELKGLGPKTIHCLLLFGLGREAFPVDTHILRVGKRLGFIPEKMDGAHAHPWMVPLIPDRRSLSLHINLIRFGRSICKATQPHCEHCFLRCECLYPA